MTSSFNHHLHLIFFLLNFISTTFAASSLHPKGVLFPLSKDGATLQYMVKTTQRTPSKHVPLTLALGSPFLWQDCDKGYVSSTYRLVPCNSAQCTLAGSTACGTCNSSPRPGCNKNTCGLSPENPFTKTATCGELATDVLRINSTDGANLGRVVTAPNFLFSCASTFLLKGLAKGVQGIAGFGRTKISVPSQLTSTFNLPKKFAICLTSSTTDDGVIFFGDGPYRIYPSLDVTASLSYTPLLANPKHDSDYYIGVTSIKIGNTSVPINKDLLSINNKGSGGTKFSTIHPYTVMETSILDAVISYFDKELNKQYIGLANATRVKAVAPFKLCYARDSLVFSRPGVQVPSIYLVLQSKKVAWAIYGGNSMLTVKDNVMCLAFVDGGKNTETSIVLGGYQLEDNILQFDLAKSRLAFDALSNTRCQNFNFTTV